MAEKKVIGAMELITVEEQYGPVRATVSLTIWSVTGDVLDEEVVAGLIQNAAIRAVVHLSLIKAMSNAFLKNDDFLAPIATFVLSYVDKESNCIKMEEDIIGFKIRTVSYLHH